jgi:hypothetical protein
MVVAYTPLRLAQLTWIAYTLTERELPAQIGRWLGQPPGSQMVLVERAPTGADRPAALAHWLQTSFETWGHAVTLIGPGEWKPWVKGNPLPEDWRGRTRSAHERDALGLLWYWLNTRKEEA